LKALDGQDCVIHLAAETGTGQSMYEIKKYTDVNTGGTALLLDILANKSHTVKKIMVASSRAIYGEGKYSCPVHGIVYPGHRTEKDMASGDFRIKCPVCSENAELLSTDEESLAHPASIYGITKLTQEQLVITAGKALGIPSVAFRYQNVYGPGQSLSNPYTGILSIFSTRIRNGGNINIFEDGQESRDFVYIDDVVKATILGMENPAADYQVFNVGSGIPVDVLTVARNLNRLMDGKSHIFISGNYRIGDIRHNYADLNKIRTVLGFNPSVSFDQGLSGFVDWVKEQDILNDKYERSLEEMKEKGLFK